ncbi:MAG: matrixin family metalloprotease [Bacteriovoracaceae bacterium]|nr:matrixin family metalloprotease [Bacteriovoracaceae bacterium]
MKIIPRSVETLIVTATMTSSLLLQGCIGTKSSSSTSAASSGFTLYKYAASSLPLTTIADSDFSALDLTEIQSIGSDWATMSDNNYSFFSISSGALSHPSSYSSWKDSSVGIYRYTTSWPSALSSGALAVTVNYGTYQGGNSVTLSASDIGVNDYTYNFYNQTDNSTYDSGEYSLYYVLAHELGHVIGLIHITSCDASLMEPYVSYATATTTLAPYSSSGKAYDKCSEAHVKGNYGVSMSAELENYYSEIKSNASSNILAGLSPEAIQAAGLEPGDDVVVAHTLMPDGSCIHDINGHKISEHKVDMRKLKGKTFEKNILLDVAKN